MSEQRIQNATSLDALISQKPKRPSRRVNYGRGCRMRAAWRARLDLLLNEFCSPEGRTMFGVYCYLKDGVKIAEIFDGVLYLNMSKSMRNHLQEVGYPAIYTPRSGFYTSMLIHPDMADDRLTELLQDSINESIERKTKEVGTPLRDGVNISRATERMLKNVGIRTLKNLEEVGSAEAYTRLVKLYPVKASMLYRLEGAIRKVNWQLLTISDRQKLLSQLESETKSELAYG